MIVTPATQPKTQRCTRCRTMKPLYDFEVRTHTGKPYLTCKHCRQVKHIQEGNRVKPALSWADRRSIRWVREFKHWQKLGYTEATMPPSEHDCGDQSYQICRLIEYEVSQNELIVYCLHCQQVWRTGSASKNSLGVDVIIGYAESHWQTQARAEIADHLRGR